MSITNVLVGSQTVSATVDGVSGIEYTVSLGSQSHTGLSDGDTFSFGDLEPESTYDIDIYQVVPLTKTILVFINSTQALSLGEVQAFTSDGVNVALKGTASQSSTAHGGAASRAINGFTSGIWSSGNVTHTTKHDGNKWWKVVLDQPYPVVTIKVYNRRDCCNTRLNGAVLTARDSSGTVLARKTLSSSTNVQILTIS